MSKSASSPVAYSYIRFSTPEQAKGDSLRRQVEMAEAYCLRRGWVLDQSLTLRDLGMSAFRGDNAMVGNLRTFLDAVRRGTVLPGSALIVESVDRISRQGIDEGYDLCKMILKAGVHIVTLSPERDFGPEAVKSLSKGALELQLILERAAEESERKSDRNGAAWVEKRRLAREGKNQPPRKKDGRVTKSLTGRLPAWVEDRGGQLRLIPERAAVVKQVFELAAAGYGQGLIVKKLTDAKVPAFGDSGKWLRAYIAKLLRDRRAVGELTPCSRNGKPEEPIADYYPRAITEELWMAARGGAARRDRMPGRKRAGGGKFVHLFDGLLRDAKAGGAFYLFYRGPKGAAQRFVINAAGFERHERIVTFPLDALEKAILDRLREIDPHEILNGDDGPDETLALSAQLAGVEAELAEATAFMNAHGFSPTIGKRITDLEARKRELAARLVSARQKAAHPLSESWGECKSLLATLESAPDPEDARVRLRTALRRIAEAVWLLVVPRGRDRLCAVQIWFAGDKRRRDYLIYYRPANASKFWRRPEAWRVWSLASVAKPGELDLRKPAHARKLEKALAALDLEALAALAPRS